MFVHTSGLTQGESGRLLEEDVALVRQRKAQSTLNKGRLAVGMIARSVGLVGLAVLAEEAHQLQDVVLRPAFETSMEDVQQIRCVAENNACRRPRWEGSRSDSDSEMWRVMWKGNGASDMFGILREMKNGWREETQNR